VDTIAGEIVLQPAAQPRALIRLEIDFGIRDLDNTVSHPNQLRLIDPNSSGAAGV
jgi:hypothetical protein